MWIGSAVYARHTNVASPRTQCPHCNSFRVEALTDVLYSAAARTTSDAWTCKRVWGVARRHRRPTESCTETTA